MDNIDECSTELLEHSQETKSNRFRDTLRFIRDHHHLDHFSFLTGYFTTVELSVVRDSFPNWKLVSLS